MVTSLREAPSRRSAASVLVETAAALAAIAVVVTQLPTVAHVATTRVQFWFMLALAMLASTQAFVSARPPGRAPMIIRPSICFVFAIQLCWGLGPALVAQAASIAMASVRLRPGIRANIWIASQLSLAFAAAAVILWIGDPDPFQRDGPNNVAVDAVSVLGAVAVWLIVFCALDALKYGVDRRRVRSPAVASAIGNWILFTASLLLLSPFLAVTAHIDIGFVPLIFIPLYAVHRMAKLSAERHLAARLDPLTGLANRVGLRLGLEQISALCAADEGRPRRRATLLVLDLDRFKQVNDALGHDVGDQLLVAVARRLAALRPADGTVARLGGDEFAILTATSDPREAEALAARVVDALVDPVTLDGLRVDVTASVGIAVRDNDLIDFTTLMRRADSAMYDAKQRSDAVATYLAVADANTPERLRILTDFRNALEADDRDQISMHYQPQVNLSTGTVDGVEALLRWRHPTYGMIDTLELLSVVEHSSVMQLLTLRVIDEVVQQVGAWHADGIDLRASINVSHRDLYADAIIDHLDATLARHHVDPGQIQIEITEGALIADPSRAIGTVNRLRALGVTIALDDFGTGYSSLQHLRKLPIAEVKIDRSFVSGMADNHDDAAIVRSTIGLARSLGIRSVAEGVENEYTRQLLVDAGCSLAQGWLTAYPMPGDDFAGWMRTNGLRTGECPAEAPRSARPAVSPGSGLAEPAD